MVVKVGFESGEVLHLRPTTGSRLHVLQLVMSSFETQLYQFLTVLIGKVFALLLNAQKKHCTPQSMLGKKHFWESISNTSETLTHLNKAEQYPAPGETILEH